MSKKAAKILLEYGNLENYVESFLDEGVFDFLSQRLQDYYKDEVVEAIKEAGEDLDDYTPSYESWEELYDSEYDNIVETSARILAQELNFDPNIDRNDIEEFLSKEVDSFLRKNGGASVFWI